MFRYLKLIGIALGFAIVTGCASVPMESPEADAALKTFDAPPAGQAGLYIYRDNFAGKGLKKTVLIDGKVIGETANRVYFHRYIAPGKHTLATESEFSNNEIELMAVAGKNYYVRQSIKMGVFVGGARLDIVPEDVGQKHIQKCTLASSQ